MKLLSDFSFRWPQEILSNSSGDEVLRKISEDGSKDFDADDMAHGAKQVLSADGSRVLAQIEAGERLYEEASNVVGSHESWDDLHAALKAYEQAREGK